MAQNKRNRRNKQEKKKTKIMRCKNHNRPVFGHEVCDTFNLKSTGSNEKNCENCINSF